MNALLRKLQIRRAVGICELDNELFLTEVASTPLGSVVLAQHRQPCRKPGDPKDLASLLGQVVPNSGPRMPRIGVTVSTSNCYCVTHAIPGESRDGLIPEDELRGMLSGASASQGGQLGVDQSPLKIGRRRFATVMACPRDFLQERIEALRAENLPAPLFQPVAWALTSAWRKESPPPKGARLWIRVTLERGFGLAVLCHKSHAAGWREFDTSSVDVGMAVKKAVLSLVTYARKSLALDTPSAVIVEGDDPGASQAAARVGEMGLRVEVREKRASLGHAASLGIGLACLDRSPEVRDLARSLRPPQRLRDLIPWGDLALTAGMLFAIWLIINGQYLLLHQKLGKALGETCRDPKIRNCSNQDLKTQCTALASQVRAFNKFLEERETWGKYLAAISTWLPPQACLMDVQGAAPLPLGKETKESRRSLTFTCAANIGQGGAAPAEIDEFVQSLRNKELLKRFFPMVELANVRWRKEGNSGHTLFSVACLPKRKFKTIVHEQTAAPGAEKGEH